MLKIGGLVGMAAGLFLGFMGILVAIIAALAHSFAGIVTQSLSLSSVGLFIGGAVLFATHALVASGKVTISSGRAQPPATPQ